MSQQLSLKEAKAEFWRSVEEMLISEYKREHHAAARAVQAYKAETSYLGDVVYNQGDQEVARILNQRLANESTPRSRRGA